MKEFLIVLCFCLLSTAVVSAQSFLSNGSMELPSEGQMPSDWSLMGSTTTATLQKDDVHCGDLACRVTAGANFSEFGKQKTISSLLTSDILRVRFRIKCPDLPPSAVLKVKCAGYDQTIPSWWNSPLLGSTDLQVNQSPHWQEFILQFSPTVAITTPTLVRFHATLQGATGESFLIDSVDFSESKGVFITSERSNARQVLSTKMSLVYDEVNRTIRELREIETTPQGFVAFGANWLQDTSSSNIHDNALINVMTRATVAGGQSTHRSTNAAAFTFSVSPITDVGKSGWRIQSTTSPIGPMSVDIVAIDGEPEIFITPTVTRSGTTLVEKIDCPNFVFDVDQDDDLLPDGLNLVTPRGGGALHPLDHEYFSDLANDGGSGGLSDRYPGAASLQMVAIYRDSPEPFGFAIQGRDVEYRDKEFIVRVDGPAALPTHTTDIAVRHRLPSATAAEINETQIVSFTRALVPFCGDWRTAAETYRNWIRGTQIWTNAAGRQTSSWVNERPVVFDADMKPQGIGSEMVPPQEWSGLMATWRQYFASTGANQSGVLQPLFRSFEQHGVYMGPYIEPLSVLSTTYDPLSGLYLPLRTEAEILSAWNDIYVGGNWPMAMVATLKWAVERIGSLPLCDANGLVPPSSDPNARPPSASNWDPAYNVANVTTGTPWDGIVVEDRNSDPDLTPLPSSPRSYSYSNYTMDPRHSFTTQTYTSLATTMASSGMRLFLLDQWHGTHVPDNFDPQYPAGTRGAGQWKANASRELIEDILAAGRAQSKGLEFETAVEDPTETAIDLIALHGIRPNNIRKHPARAYGDAEPIPLFPYVFNEVVSFSTWNVSMPTEHFTLGTYSWWPNNGLTVDHVRQKTLTEYARVLSSGALLPLGYEDWMIIREVVPLPVPCPNSGFGNTLLPTPDRIDSLLLEFLRSCVHTSQGPAREFLNKGKMIQAQGLDGLGVVSLQLDEGGVIAVVDQPLIHHSAYELDNGQTALLLVSTEIGNTATTVTLPTHLGETQLSGTFNLHKDGGPAVVTNYTAGMTLSVPARGVLLLVF